LRFEVGGSSTVLAVAVTAGGRVLFGAELVNLGDTRPGNDDVVGREVDDVAALFVLTAIKVKVEIKVDDEVGGPWTPGSTDRYSPVSVLLYLETKPR
jgi:hypothetical protein